MIYYPLKIQFEKKSSSPLRQALEALDSPVVFYLVFVLPFLLLAALFRSTRSHSCIFDKEAITVYYGRIVTQKIGRDQVRGIDAVASDSAGVLRIRWKKRMNEAVPALDLPGTCFRALNMSLEDIAAALRENYGIPAGNSYSVT